MRAKPPKLRPYPQCGDLDEFLRTTSPARSISNNCPSTIRSTYLFSSGTTGKPKCIVHGAGAVLLKHLSELRFQADVKAGDRLFYFSTCGWMMWNWLMSGLACEATLLLYDGSPFAPSERVLFDYADEEGMNIFGTSAKYIDALEKTGWRPATAIRLQPCGPCCPPARRWCGKFRLCL